ncbi:MAG: type II toxin-antitoxin system VapC family toxin [Acidobacteriota bacterium]
MTRGVLVDAGPMVAILHRDDRDHQACVEALKRIRVPLLTTWMPVTEAMYLLDFSAEAQSGLLEMIERGGLRLVPVDTDDLPSIRALLRKYRDLPMDFADATLVHVANRDGLRDIFTLDRRDFGVYRLKRGRSFNIIPSR